MIGVDFSILNLVFDPKLIVEGPLRISRRLDGPFVTVSPQARSAPYGLEAEFLGL